MSFQSIFDSRDGSNSFEESFKEEDHLLIFMDVDSPVIVKDVETNGDDDVQMGWLEHQEVLVLILEHKLVDEGVFLSGFKSLAQLVHVEVMRSVSEDL